MKYTVSICLIVVVAVVLPLLTRGEDEVVPSSPTITSAAAAPSTTLHPMTYMCRNGHLDAIASRSYKRATSVNVENDAAGSSSSQPSSAGSLWEGAVGATNWLWGSLRQAVLITQPPSPAHNDDNQVQKIPSADSDENDLSSVQKMTAGYECKGYNSGESSPSRHPQIMGISERHQAQTVASNIHIFSGLLSLEELIATTRTNTATTNPAEGANVGSGDDSGGLVASTKAHLLETLIYLHGKMYGTNPSAGTSTTTANTSSSSVTPPPLPTAETLDALLNDTSTAAAATEQQYGGKQMHLRSSVLLIAPGGSYEKLSPFETNGIPFQVLGYSSILERSLAPSSSSPIASSTSAPKQSNFLPVAIQYRVRPVSPFSPAHDISQAVRFFERVKRNVGASSSQNAAIPTPEALGLTANFTVVIVGFSAGGHAVGTYLAKLNSPTNTLVKAAALIYPVISLFDNDLLHRKSRKNLFSGTSIFESSVNNTDSTLLSTQMAGKVAALSPFQNLMSRTFSLELHPENFPPYVYLAHSREDSTVPVENSIHMFTSLVKHRKAQAALKRSQDRRFGTINRSTSESAAAADQQIFNEHQSYQVGGGRLKARATNDVTLRLYTHGAHGRWLFAPREAPNTNSEADTRDWYDKLETWFSTVVKFA